MGARGARGPRRAGVRAGRSLWAGRLCRKHSVTGTQTCLSVYAVLPETAWLQGRAYFLPGSSWRRCDGPVPRAGPRRGRCGEEAPLRQRNVVKATSVATERRTRPRELEGRAQPRKRLLEQEPQGQATPEPGRVCPRAVTNTAGTMGHTKKSKRAPRRQRKQRVIETASRRRGRRGRQAGSRRQKHGQRPRATHSDGERPRRGTRGDEPHKGPSGSPGTQRQSDPKGRCRGARVTARQ